MGEYLEQLVDPVLAQEYRLPVSDEHMRFARTDAVPFASRVAGLQLENPAWVPVVRLGDAAWFRRAFGHGLNYVHGAYSLSIMGDHILLNDRNANLENLFDQSVLVHEAAHWLQAHSWGVEKFIDTPVSVRELGAYRTQLAYSAFHGVHPAQLAPNVLTPDNLFDQTQSDELYRDDYAWLQPWLALGRARATAVRLFSRGRGRVPTRAALRVVGGGTLRTVALTEPLNDTLPKAEKYLLREKDRWERSEQYIGKQLRVEIDYE